MDQLVEGHTRWSGSNSTKYVNTEHRPGARSNDYNWRRGRYWPRQEAASVLGSHSRAQSATERREDEAKDDRSPVHWSSTHTRRTPGRPEESRGNRGNAWARERQTCTEVVWLGELSGKVLPTPVSYTRAPQMAHGQGFGVVLIVYIYIGCIYTRRLLIARRKLSRAPRYFSTMTSRNRCASSAMRQTEVMAQDCCSTDSQ